MSCPSVNTAAEHINLLILSFEPLIHAVCWSAGWGINKQGIIVRCVTRVE